jgi:hypothetical protein
VTWIVPTLLFIVGGFAIAFGFCEWFMARRETRSRNGDGPAHG